MTVHARSPAFEPKSNTSLDNYFATKSAIFTVELEDVKTSVFVHKRAMTIDHVQPVSRGGGTNWLNCVLACNRCNHLKGNRTPREAGMELQRDPFQPTRDQLILCGVNTHESWNPFLSEKHVKVNT